MNNNVARRYVHKKCSFIGHSQKSQCVQCSTCKNFFNKRESRMEGDQSVGMLMKTDFWICWLLVFGTHLNEKTWKAFGSRLQLFLFFHVMKFFFWTKLEFNSSNPQIRNGSQLEMYKDMATMVSLWYIKTNWRINYCVTTKCHLHVHWSFVLCALCILYCFIGTNDKSLAIYFILKRIQTWNNAIISHRSCDEKRQLKKWK